MKEDTDKVEAGRLEESRGIFANAGLGPLGYWGRWATDRIDVLMFRLSNTIVERDIARREIERLEADPRMQCPLDGPGSHRVDLQELRLLQKEIDRLTDILHKELAGETINYWKDRALKAENTLEDHAICNHLEEK